MHQKLLVISGNAPGYDGVGAILIRQILEVLSRQNLRIIALRNRDQINTKNINNPWVDLSLLRRYEPSFRPFPNLAGELISFSANRLLLGRHINKLMASVVEASKQHQCQAIFAVLDCPTVILMAEKLAKQLNLPLYCFVMDHPNLFVRDFGYDRFFKAYLLRCFDRVMNYADRIAVAGETMQTAFEKRYGKQSVILRQGLDYEKYACRDNSHKLLNPDCVRIGFAGSLTAKDTFEQFLASLDRCQWRLADKPVILRILGAHIKLIPTGPQHIEYFGWRSLDELVTLMEECNILYLPQSFEPSLKDFTELSFPNKLCTYIPAKRPIALHAPPGSSIVNFYSKYACGPLSTSYQCDELLDSLESTLKNRQVYKQYQDSADEVFAKEINRQQLTQNSILFFNKNL
ncbi:hypothetical protein IQ218_11015 [Synechocystis salina LEGE 06099]|uniref:hypothetical protein n=1 Tax=Synechocystis salina TaxID=945780 RepID=UPI00188153C2|nr:hypothetical protein [Synechocystis salina]MBE9203874.1 hypothetical protein [Synechocystis salina LEGE 06099]